MHFLWLYYYYCWSEGSFSTSICLECFIFTISSILLHFNYLPLLTVYGLIVSTIKYVLVRWACSKCFLYILLVFFFFFFSCKNFGIYCCCCRCLLKCKWVDNVIIKFTVILVGYKI